MPFPFFGKQKKLTSSPEQVDFDQISDQIIDNLWDDKSIEFGSQEHFNLLFKATILDMFSASYPNLKFYKRDQEASNNNLKRLKERLKKEPNFNRINSFLDTLIKP